MRDHMESKKLPIVTIVVPVYRARASFPNALRSICMQTYGLMQLIIVDDGPNSVVDGDVFEMLSAYGNRFVDVTILHNEFNLGISKSLNHATGVAIGDIIFTLADDDEFYDESTIYDWTMEFITSGVDLITARRSVYDESMSILLHNEPSEKQMALLTEGKSQDVFEAISGFNFIFGPCTAKTKDLLVRIGGYPEKIHTIEDYAFILKYLRYSKTIHFYDRLVVKCRSGGVSSPKNINRAYFKESNYIFWHYIFPFAHHKLNALRKFHSWKRAVKLTKQ